MLQILFGDDEHTAAEGPYSRLMKTRKWIYISVAISAILTMRLYDEKAAHELIKFVQLPSVIIAHGILLGLVYLTALFILLIFQLRTSYDIILNERMISRQQKERAEALTKLVQAESDVESAIDEVKRRDVDARRTLWTALEHASVEANEAMATEDGLTIVTPDPARAGVRQRVHKATQEVARIKSKIQELDAGPSIDAIAEEDGAVRLARRSLQDANENLNALLQLDPSRRPGYRNYEVAIDILRLAPPILASTLAILNIIIAFHLTRG